MPQIPFNVSAVETRDDTGRKVLRVRVWAEISSERDISCEAFAKRDQQYREELVVSQIEEMKAEAIAGVQSVAEIEKALNLIRKVAFEQYPSREAIDAVIESVREAMELRPKSSVQKPNPIGYEMP